MPLEAPARDIASAEASAAGPRLDGRRWLGTASVLLAVAVVAATLYAASLLLRPVDSDQGTLRGLQIRVLNISQAAAESRMDGALAALDALEKDLDDAAGQGLISLPRYRGIEAAVKTVRADIAGRIEAVSKAAAEVPAAGSAGTPASPVPAEAQQPVEVDAQPPAVVSVPVPVTIQDGPAAPEPAKGAKAKGKDKGKGKQ
jgi:hypothetical protein